MSASTLTIKPANHRVHPVIQEKKIELLKLLLEQNTQLSIFIFTEKMQNELSEIAHSTNVKLLPDTELQDGMQADYVISLDLPKDASIYIQRVKAATQKAALLLNQEEQNALYPIETLLQRALKQEIISGFGYPSKPKSAPKEETKAATFAPRKNFEKKPFVKSDKPKKDFEKKPFEKSEKPKKDFKIQKPKGDTKKKENRFLGKDENGKAIFSGKSGERNHYFDGKPKPKEEQGNKSPKPFNKKQENFTPKEQPVKKTGKTINIKARKEKPQEK